MGVSKNRGGPPKWMVKIMKNPIKMDDLGVPLFLETSTSISTWACIRLLFGLVLVWSGFCCCSTFICLLMILDLEKNLQVFWSISVQPVPTSPLKAFFGKKKHVPAIIGRISWFYCWHTLTVWNILKRAPLWVAIYHFSRYHTSAAKNMYIYDSLHPCGNLACDIGEANRQVSCKGQVLRWFVLWVTSKVSCNIQDYPMLAYQLNKISTEMLRNM